jgi:hypothetical protein
MYFRTLNSINFMVRRMTLILTIQAVNVLRSNGARSRNVCCRVRERSKYYVCMVKLNVLLTVHHSISV